MIGLLWRTSADVQSANERHRTLKYMIGLDLDPTTYTVTCKSAIHASYQRGTGAESLIGGQLKHFLLLNVQ